MIQRLMLDKYVLLNMLPLLFFLFPVTNLQAEKEKETNKITSADSSEIMRLQPANLSAFECSLQILSPENRTLTCADSIKVVVKSFVQGGIAPYSAQCTINGKSVLLQQDTLKSFIPLLAGENLIGIHCIFTDDAGNVSQCADTVVVEKCGPLTGSAKIISPQENAFICDDSVDVVVVGFASGGVPEIITECYINGFPARVDGDTLRARIVMNGAVPLIGTTCIFTDAEGNEAEATDIIFVNNCDPLTSSVAILSPLPQSLVCGENVEVLVLVQSSGGVGPVTKECTINGSEIVFSGDTLRATVPIVSDETFIGVHCIFTDSLGNIHQSADTVSVQICPPLEADFTILTPENREVICGDSVLVTAVHNVQGGLAPYSFHATINDFPAIVSGDTIRAQVPILADTTFIGVYSQISDAAGNLTHFVDTLYIEKCEALQSQIEIIWPYDDASICLDSIEVVAVVEVSGGVAPFQVEGAINGVPALITGDTLRAKIPLSWESTLIAAYAAFTDAGGKQSFCSDVSTVQKCDNFKSAVTIHSPAAGDSVCGDSINVIASVVFDGGTRPISATGTINGIPLKMENDSLRAAIPLLPNSTFIGLHSVFTDADGNIIQAADTLTVFACEEKEFLSFAVLLSPDTQSEICSDSIQVVALAKFTGGREPVTAECTINGQTAIWVADTIRATIPVFPDQNFVAVHCIFTETDGQITQAADTSFFFGCNSGSFQGEVSILYPKSGQVICEDSLQVVAIARSDGGLGNVVNNCTINGIPAVVKNDTVFATIARQNGKSTFLGVFCQFTDAIGNITQAADTTTVFGCEGEVFRGSVAIFSPFDGATFCKDSVKLKAVINWTGAVEPVKVQCTINGVPVAVSGDTINYPVALPMDRNLFGIHCIFTDAEGQITQSADTVTVFRCDEGFKGFVNLLSPESGEIFSADSILVKAKLGWRGGGDFVSVNTKINGRPTNILGDIVQAWVPLFPGANFIGVHALFTDGDGNITQAADTATVFQQESACNIAILSPIDSSMICHYDSVDVIIFSEVIGSNASTQLRYTVNGQSRVAPVGEFTIRTAMRPGWLPIVAKCEIASGTGINTASMDSIVVFFDKTPPLAEINFDNLPEISGRVWDDESGLDWVKMVSINNRIVEFDDFQPGDKRINFTSMPIDMNKPSSFTFKVKNMAGCFEEVDPIYLQLAPQGETLFYSFKLPPQDRYMRIENLGVERITLVINDQPVHLLTDINKNYGAGTVYRLPQFGRLAIDIHRFLGSDSSNFELICDGPRGAVADFLIADRETDNVITEIKENHFPDVLVATDFALGQNYPNPFNAETVIEYALPENAQVTLRIFNVLGQEIITLVDDFQAAGIHRARWNGINLFGRVAASGVYIYKMDVKTSNRQRWEQTRKLNLLR